MPSEKTRTKSEGRAGTATPDALLGLLSMGPMSGYDMRMAVSRSIGHFWSESFGQIYPALKRLTAEGCVAKKTERQKGRPDRNVYSLTEKGRERLQEWLMVPAVAEVPRNELLLKLFFGGHAPLSASRENVETFLGRHEQALKVYAEIGKRIRSESRDNPRAPFWLMTVSFGRHYSEALVKWGRETLKELDAMEQAAEKKTARRGRAQGRGKR